jgi:PAS domain S-box-containing protein
VYVNDRVGPILGYTASEISAMGGNFLRLTMHPDDYRDYPAVLEAYARARDGDVLERVMRLRHKNGEWRWIHRHAVVFTRDAEGKPLQILGSAVDITAVKQTEQQLRELSGRLLSVQDEERRRIARELHDSIAQLLFGITSSVQQLRARADLPAAAWQKLFDAESLCDEALKQVRSISYLLHPPLLDEVGLVAALEWLVNGLRARTGIDVELDAGGGGGERLPLPLERDLFRIVQEGLGNVMRHSGSARAVVRLERRDDSAVLQVQDFGRGMSSAAGASSGPSHSLGVGIAGMRERLHLIGGRLDIESGPQGTTLTATVPVSAGLAGT